MPLNFLLASLNAINGGRPFSFSIFSCFQKLLVIVPTIENEEELRIRMCFSFLFMTQNQVP